MIRAGGNKMEKNLHQKCEKLQKEGIHTKKVNVEALLLFDNQGYIVGIKLPDESNFLGKSIDQFK
jgi:hypothetical protein